MEPGDYSIERSEEQKRLRLKKLRAELFDLGYSVVKTEYLQTLIDTKLPLKHCDDAAAL